MELVFNFVYLVATYSDEFMNAVLWSEDLQKE